MFKHKKTFILLSLLAVIIVSVTVFVNRNARVKESALSGSFFSSFSDNNGMLVYAVATDSDLSDLLHEVKGRRGKNSKYSIYSGNMVSRFLSGYTKGMKRAINGNSLSNKNFGNQKPQRNNPKDYVRFKHY